MYVHGGCIDLVGCPLYGKLEWLKDLSIYEGMLRHFNSSMVMCLMVPMFHTLDVVYVHGGGALTLLDVPGGGK